MQRTVLDASDRFRVQRKLDRNETLVWVGRPVPTYRYRGWIGTVLFAIPWCAITGTFVGGVLIPAWMGKPVDGEAWGIWPKLGLTAFLTPFILIGIGFANIFPLIFSICVDKMPEKTNEISGLMTTAIVGAAIVPLITGAAANVAPKYAFFVTLACLLYLGFVALRNRDTVNA